jgi:drug/metabolite transporter (DMT)-like permease
MAEAVYVLCALTSVACAGLMIRSWRRNRERLLAWSAVCFAALAVNNCLLFLDRVIVPERDLTLWRNIPALLGVAALLAGLIWETT